MNKVLTISLNSIAYQLEEAGYEALHQYLQKAKAKLHDNPDKDEIMADLEQAIADKCDKYLNSHKNVVTSKEIEKVLKEMGPVEDVADAQEKPHANAGQGEEAPKRLFKIREGAVFEGVCNGLAAYFNLDVTLVRVAFIVLTPCTGGSWIAVYILMAIFMPEARTAEDMAAAQGKAFNAKTLIDGARERYEYWKKFGEEQSKDWKNHKYEYKNEWKNWKYEQKKQWKQTVHPKVVAAQAEQPEAYSGTVRRISRGLAGIVGGIGVLLIVIMNIAWAIGFYGVFTGGTILGYFAGTSKLVLAALLASTFLIVLMPLSGITGDALRCAAGKPVMPYFWGRFIQYIVWFAALAVVVMLAIDIPEVRDGLAKMYQDVVNAHWFGL
jgi:phage shock protein PspC (stress-responsive transcriptional regulator)